MQFGIHPILAQNAAKGEVLLLQGLDVTVHLRCKLVDAELLQAPIIKRDFDEPTHLYSMWPR
jgi:hypothetical protein